MSQRRGGMISVQVNGTVYDAKGSFTYGLGLPKREAIVGTDGVHGYKELPQVPFIEGAFTDKSDLDVKTLQSVKDGVITLSLANGKVVVLGGAYYAHEGSVGTEEGEIPVRFEGDSAEEI